LRERFDDTHIYAFLADMKTTLDLPVGLFMQAKALAALRKQKVKDLVTRGLQMVVDAETQAAHLPTPLEMMRLIRTRPLYDRTTVEAHMQDAVAERKGGWMRNLPPDCSMPLVAAAAVPLTASSPHPPSTINRIWLPGT
jgi:hypothetical protein